MPSRRIPYFKKLINSCLQSSLAGCTSILAAVGLLLTQFTIASQVPRSGINSLSLTKISQWLPSGTAMAAAMPTRASALAFKLHVTCVIVMYENYDINDFVVDGRARCRASLLHSPH
ncbi:hypothetical protein MRB53_006038 [Persea americana]|uniref:Uncharacterized protein n=1 Tax=Persea americana TaxID=3435 RepID=A0ACC2MF27_PERAE|nr:hypothetical protein MRB53_006038 [Persea americana]